MRTLGFRTHLVLVLTGAAGLVFSLTRPWYAAAPATVPGDNYSIGDLTGPLDKLVQALQRTATENSGMRGWEALDHWALAIAVLSGIAVLGALACLTPLQSLGRDLLRYGALAAAAVTIWKLVDTPGPNSELELRYGALIAGASALMLLTCAMGVANAPLRRRVVVPKYQAPPPPVWTDTAGSTAPPN